MTASHCDTSYLTASRAAAARGGVSAPTASSSSARATARRELCVGSAVSLRPLPVATASSRISRSFLCHLTAFSPAPRRAAAPTCRSERCDASSRARASPPAATPPTRERGGGASSGRAHLFTSDAAVNRRHREGRPRAERLQLGAHSLARHLRPCPAHVSTGGLCRTPRRARPGVV